MSFKDKVVIVTGASSGIGAAIAIAFSAEDATVVIVGRNEVKLAATAAKCPRKLVIKADVTNDDEAKRIIDETVQKLGKIDILINNAGASFLANIFDDNIMKAYDSQMNLNLRAVIRMTSLAIPHLIKTKGNIVNMSSVLGCTTQCSPEFLMYSVSKASLIQFGAYITADLAPHGVRVNTVTPGPVETDFLENSNITNGTWDDFGAMTSLKKASKPEEVADLVLFVASDKAKSITGSNYVCDNGFLVKR